MTKIIDETSKEGKILPNEEVGGESFLLQGEVHRIYPRTDDPSKSDHFKVTRRLRPFIRVWGHQCSRNRVEPLLSDLLSVES